MTNIARQCVSWLLSGIFGVVGAFAYTHWHSSRMEKVPVLRSSRFELTDDSGRVISFWGADKGNNIVMAFLQRGNRDLGPEQGVPSQQTSFAGQNPNEAIGIGMTSAQIPFINLQAKDGTSRALLYLAEYQKPVLVMSDESFEGRLTLGFITNDAPSPRDDDWALRFRGPEVAGIGSIKDPVDHKYRGFLSVQRKQVSRSRRARRLARADLKIGHYMC